MFDAAALRIKLKTGLLYVVKSKEKKKSKRDNIKMQIHNVIGQNGVICFIAVIDRKTISLQT